MDIRRSGPTWRDGDACLTTPAGKLTLRHEVLPEMVATGVEPYLRDHLIKDEADYRIVESILERARVRTGNGEWLAARRLKSARTVMSCRWFIGSRSSRRSWNTWAKWRSSTLLHDDAARVQRLLHLLDQQMVEILRHLADLPATYLEFPDNLHGGMTNPRLFARYCLPDYQRYTGILHGQGKVAGSHTDGDVGPLWRCCVSPGWMSASRSRPSR